VMSLVFVVVRFRGFAEEETCVEPKVRILAEHRASTVSGQAALGRRVLEEVHIQDYIILEARIHGRSSWYSNWKRRDM
jgi:hypothetical protein